MWWCNPERVLWVSVHVYLYKSMAVVDGALYNAVLHLVNSCSSSKLKTQTWYERVKSVCVCVCWDVLVHVDSLTEHVDMLLFYIVVFMFGSIESLPYVYVHTASLWLWPF